MQKPVEWSPEKNEWLRQNRGICFDDVLAAIDSGSALVIEDSPSKRHPNQKMYIVMIRRYAYAVPFVEDETKIFLKTLYPSRKFTKKYLLSSK